MTKTKLLYQRIFRRRGLYAFLTTLDPESAIMDVGCGNDSSHNIKSSFPSFNYTGIDIGSYNQTKPLLADSYVLTTPENFPIEIAKFTDHFDAVISSHNLEHCNSRASTLSAMLKAVKKGGKLYLSFPCEASVNFPHRKRTLNYFDDDTHKFSPPDFDGILSTLRDQGFLIEYSFRRYQPAGLWLIGLIQEPIARFRNTILQGTWAYYGFESIIWAKKIN